MKPSASSFNLKTSFIKLKDESFLKNLRIAGKCVSEIMIMLEGLVKNKTSLSMIEIDKLVGDEIENRGCLPTFYLYKGFPGKCCISINHALVHGCPTDYKLQEGDVVSFDFGATYNGAVADSAITMIYGEPKSKEHVRMIEATKQCLYNSINAISVGKRLGVIGDAIYKTARNAGFNVITSHGGHGVEIDEHGNGIPHAQPFVCNRADKNDGIIMQKGLVIAIEPLLVAYNCPITTKVGTDGWTVYTEDTGSHIEHTLYLHDDSVEVITKRENEII